MISGTYQYRAAQSHIACASPSHLLIRGCEAVCYEEGVGPTQVKNLFAKRRTRAGRHLKDACESHRSEIFLRELIATDSVAPGHLYLARLRLPLAAAAGCTPARQAEDLS